jgi:NAD(P)-dependent dehydrogenase (short-subunit alcohol dehydrogenase family)
MSPGLRGRRVLVTGGAQGIGLATVGYLLRCGALVAAADRDEEALIELRARHPEVYARRADVSDEDSVAALIAAVSAQLGGLDGLVNNAGVMVSAPLAELSLSAWETVLRTNLTGAFLCVKHALPHLKAAYEAARDAPNPGAEPVSGAVVNVASTRALMSEPDTEAYAASKGGLVALTHAFAISLGPAVRVNCVSPGWIEVGEFKKRSARTPPEHRPEDHAQHPVGRVGVPEDVASAVAYLLSAESGFVTGQNLVIDGGMTRKMLYV